MDDKILIESNDNHLTRDELVAYFDSALSNSVMRQLEIHLIDCVLCRDALEGIAHSRDTNSFISSAVKIQKTLGLKRSSYRIVMLVAASVSLLFLLSLSFWLINRNTNPQLLASKTDEMTRPPSKNAQSQSNKEKIKDLDTLSVEADLDIAQNNKDKALEERSENEPAPIAMIDSETGTGPESLGNELASRKKVSEAFEDTSLIAENKDLSVPDFAEMDLVSPIDSELQPGLTRISTSPRTISGRITGSQNGEPLPGVNVMVKGQTIETISNKEGIYTIEVPKNADKLVYAFTGMETQEQSIGETDELDISLSPDVQQLSEVITTGNDRSGKAKETSNRTSSAQPESGNPAYRRYLRQNVQYPATASDAKIKGEVTLEVIIDPSGAIKRLLIIQSLGYGCDEEAIRLVNEGPEWLAAYSNGQAIADTVTISVKFKR